MAKVIKAFHGVLEHRDFLVGDTYDGERVEELTDKGYLEAPKKTPVKKTTTNQTEEK